jgi:hypothetical protein
MVLLLALVLVGGSASEDQDAPTNCGGAMAGGGFVGALAGAAAGVMVDAAGYYVTVEMLGRDEYCGSADAPLLGFCFYAPVFACFGGTAGAVSGVVIADAACVDAPTSSPGDMKH